MVLVGNCLLYNNWTKVFAFPLTGAGYEVYETEEQTKKIG
jgi:hypothetical protein